MPMERTTLWRPVSEPACKAVANQGDIRKNGSKHREQLADGIQLRRDAAPRCRQNEESRERRGDAIGHAGTRGMEPRDRGSPLCCCWQVKHAEMEDRKVNALRARPRRSGTPSLG